MADPRIIVPKWNTDVIDKEEAAAIAAARESKTPIRITCPDCRRIFSLFIESMEQGMHTILGHKCPFCKRIIRETDDPEALLTDLKEIREALQEGAKNGTERHNDKN